MLLDTLPHAVTPPLATTTAAAARDAAKWAATYLPPADASHSVAASPCWADWRRTIADGATLHLDRSKCICLLVLSQLLCDE